MQSLPKRRPHKVGIPPGHGIRNGVIAVLREESHDAGHGEPRCSAQRNEQQQQAAFEQRHQDHDEDDIGQRVEDVDGAHHDLVQSPPEVAGDRAIGHPDQKRDQS